MNFVGTVDSFELNSKVDISTFEIKSKFNLQSKTIDEVLLVQLKFESSAWSMSHGQNHRLIGSIGQATTPEIKKGKKMHTRYGNETVTIENLELVSVDGEYLFLRVQFLVRIILFYLMS